MLSTFKAEQGLTTRFQHFCNLEIDAHEVFILQLGVLMSLIKCELDCGASKTPSHAAEGTGFLDHGAIVFRSL